MRGWLLLPIVLAACDTAANDTAAKNRAASHSAVVKSSAATPSADPCSKAQVAGAIAWIHDDFATALACARAKKLPLVIDWWAPWCHTCLSMKTTVLADASFAVENSKFIFAALNGDREDNAPALAKFPVAAWPTYYVVSRDEIVLARFVGAASVLQFRAFLDTAAQAATGDLPAGHQAFLLAAERALAAKDFKTAEVQLEMAIADAPHDWPRLPDALVSLIGIKRKQRDIPGCLEVAERHLNQLGNTASASDFLASATTCAEERLAGTHDPAIIASVKNLREQAVARWRRLLGDSTAVLSVDDRSDLLVNLRETLLALNQTAQAKMAAEQQRVLLDEAAAKAPTAMAAMTYNAHRAEVYVYLGRPMDLVPALQKSAQELPNEYDPAGRLGWLLLKAGKLPEAAFWTDKALTLVRGPRTARLLSQRAEIAKALGDKASEKQLRQRAVQVLEALPASQTSAELIAQAKSALAALD